MSAPGPWHVIADRPHARASWTWKVVDNTVGQVVFRTDDEFAARAAVGALNSFDGAYRAAYRHHEDVADPHGHAFEGNRS